MKTQGFEREQFNSLFRDVRRQIAREMVPPRDDLPMDGSNYDFFSRGANLLKGMSRLRGQDLEHSTSMVLQNMVIRIPKLPRGQEEYSEEQKDLRGPIYGYERYLSKNGLEPEDYPFNRYFAMVFKRRARNEVKRFYGTGKRRDTPHISIGSGEFDENDPGGLVSEGIMPDLNVSHPSVHMEQAEEREVLDKVIPSQLDLIANERDRKILSEFYRMYILEGAKLWEVGERLDQLGEYDSDYWPEGGGVDAEGKQVPWSTSTLQRYSDTITKIMQRYYRQQRRERHQRAVTPEEKRAIFQSRRA